MNPIGRSVLGCLSRIKTAIILCFLCITTSNLMKIPRKFSLLKCASALVSVYMTILGRNVRCYLVTL